MDRKQMVVERTRAIFGERLDDVIHMVPQDRQDLRGWQEPAHVRAVLRRRTTRVGDENSFNETADVAVADSTLAAVPANPIPANNASPSASSSKRAPPPSKKLSRDKTPT